MSRWQLERVIIYSNDDRFAELKLWLSSVNIIVGDSNTGKSALLEIINYCLGSRDCLIPDHVQKHCSWVAIQWVKDGEYCFIARKLPPLGNQQGTNVYHLETGTNPEFSKKSSELQESGKADLHRFEELLRIGRFAMFQDPDSSRKPFSISLRHTIPYLLLSDDVIINKSKLFWEGQGRGTGQRHQHTVDTLPYFLGILDEDKLRSRTELLDIRKELRRLKSEIKEAERIASDGSLMVEQFLQQALELGMLRQDPIDDQEQRREALASIAHWHSGGQDFQPTGELPSLRLQEESLRVKLKELENEKKAVERTINNAQKFNESILVQKSRLDLIHLFKGENGLEACPLCNLPLGSRVEPVEKLREALNILSRDIGEINTDRPRLDAYLQELVGKINENRNQYRTVKARIEAIVAQEEAFEKEKSLENMRHHLSGMVDLFLRSKEREVRPDQTLVLREFEEKIATLEAELDEEALASANDAMAQRIAYDAKGIIEDLPFEDRYKKCMVIFDHRKLQCHLLEGARRIPMPVIGSDENYLSIHISIFLSLHRVFSENNRPVPGLMIMDQVSRPYFPAEMYREVVQLPGEGSQGESNLMDERAKVRKIFDLLFKEVESRKDLQIIVCEKAYFPDDPRFKKGIRAFWAKPDGLVPEDWPAKR